MVPVEGGTITLDPADDDSKQMDLFWIGKYEITWEQYKPFSTDVMSNLAVQNLPGNEIGVYVDLISLPSPSYVDMSFGMGTDSYPGYFTKKFFLNLKYWYKLLDHNWLHNFQQNKCEISGLSRN